MMKFISTIFATILFLPNLVSAHLHLGPCQFGVQAELLYLQASTVTQFGIQEFSATSQQLLYNNSDYEPGFRIEGLYALDCQHVAHGRFTYFNTGEQERSVSGSFVAPTDFDGTIDDTLKIRYYALEILFGRWLFDCCDFDLELEAGLIYSDVKYKEEAIFSGGISVTTVSELKFWGVGPEIVLNFEYPLPFCLNEFAVAFDARGALLASKNWGSSSDTSGVVLDFDPYYAVVPASDFKLGLNWSHRWSCLKTNLEIGYEWIYIHQGIGADNVSFHGPYLAVGAGF